MSQDRAALRAGARHLQTVADPNTQSCREIKVLVNLAQHICQGVCGPIFRDARNVPGLRGGVANRSKLLGSTSVTEKVKRVGVYAAVAKAHGF